MEQSLIRIIGASLDAEGPGENTCVKELYGKIVVANRKRMLEVCPKYDFTYQAQWDLINALHITDFHRIG